MLDRLVRLALRQARRRAVGEHGRFWMGVGAAALGVRALQWLARPRPEVVREELLPGQQLVISHLAEPS